MKNKNKVCLINNIEFNERKNIRITKSWWNFIKL